jgi:predicted Zn-dependent protease
MREQGPRSRIVGWIAAGLAAAAVSWASPARATGPAAGELDPPASSRPPLVIVRGLGPVPKRSLQRACEVVLATYPVRCEIRGSRSVFEAIAAWDEQREQLDARRTLETLLKLRGQDVGVEVNLTTADVFEDDKPYVFGLASLVDRIALVSLARLGDDPETRKRRVGTLVLHEVGHTLGLRHHDAADCVMRQDATTRSLDTAPDDLCESCRSDLRATARELGRPGGLGLDRARAHLARGEHHMARAELVSALWAGATEDSDLLHAFATAFLEAGRLNESISVLRFVVATRPDFAPAHLNLATAYESRAEAGDLSLAVAHYEAARHLRPDWDLLDAHVHALRGLAAQGP